MSANTGPREFPFCPFGCGCDDDTCCNEKGCGCFDEANALIHENREGIYG